jgi:hypothetical protein
MTKIEEREFVEAETARIIAEMEAIEASRPQKVAICSNDADESTYEAFDRAAEAITDLFIEKTRNIWNT